MSDTTTCKACDATLPPGARFCKACGTPSLPDPTLAHAATAAQAPVAPDAQPAPQAPYPYPPNPAAAASRSSWPVVAAASGAIALVAVAILVLVLTTKSAGNGVSAANVLTFPRPSPSPTESPQTKSAGASATSITPAGRASEGSSTDTQPPILVTYTGAIISARIPSGWRTIENEVHKPGYVESKWRDPAPLGDTVLIDTSPSTPGTLEQDAAPVHDALTKESGYKEIFYGPGDLASTQSWKWVFRVEGDQRVDYFFNHCASGYAVLGSAPPTHFSRLQAIFKTVAQSVRPTAEPQC